MSLLCESVTGFTILFYFAFLLSMMGMEVFGAESFDSFPLFKYDHAGFSSSSRKNSFNLAAASYHSSYDENLSRSKAILLPYQEFLRRTEQFKNEDYPEFSNNIIGNYQRTIAGGSSALIIVVPLRLDDELIPQWREAEHLLMTNELLIPVYFIHENDELHDVLSSIETLSGYEAVSVAEKIYNTFLGDNFQFTVSTKEQTLLKQITGTNIQAWLAGNGDASSPTIAIVANYDALSASPDLSPSAKTSTSSSTALLELARVFNKLYHQPRTQVNYNILFVLASGGHFNFQGSKQWIDQVDDRIIKSLEFVICLDSLGQDTETLYLHTSRPEKDTTAARLYNSFRSAGSSLGINVEVKQKKVNLSNNEEPWEHEHFSKRRILATTLSTNEEPLPNLGRSNIFDQSDDYTEQILKRNTKLVAEALARHIFVPTQELKVFEQSLEAGGSQQSLWFNALLNVPRVFPYIPETLVDSLETILKEYSTDVTKQTFTLNKKSEYTFYSATAPSKMTISVAKPFLFDVVLAVMIGLYLSGLYFFSQKLKIFQ